MIWPSISLIETGFCFSPSALRKAASSLVSSGGGVRLCLAGLGFPCGGRKGMQALYTNVWWRGGRLVRPAERRDAYIAWGLPVGMERAAAVAVNYCALCAQPRTRRPGLRGLRAAT